MCENARFTAQSYGFSKSYQIKLTQKKIYLFPSFNKLLTFGRVLETDFKSN